jgi:hypothetical protein
MTKALLAAIALAASNPFKSKMTVQVRASARGSGAAPAPPLVREPPLAAEPILTSAPPMHLEDEEDVRGLSRSMG